MTAATTLALFEGRSEQAQDGPTPDRPCPATTSPKDAPDLRTAAEDLRHGRGLVRFATVDERDAATVRLLRLGMVVVELEGIGPSAHRGLEDAVNEAIERELADRGESGAGTASIADRDLRLSDQLFRARRSGASGIAVVLGPLRAAARTLGALSPEDCSLLRFLACAARDRPLALILDASDFDTAAFGEPGQLGDVLRTRGKAGQARAGASEPATTEAAEAERPSVPEHESPTATPTATPTETSTATSTPNAIATPPPLPPPLLDLPSPSLAPYDDASWRTWTLQLAGARGPQPLSALERLFVEAYVPLTNAIGDGLDDPRARRARDQFRDSFANGYTESFPTFAATTKRPRMVLDVYDIAARTARLHGARTTRLLLVDGMRWDVANAVKGKVVEKLGTQASLSDELVLWSALPTTTIRQLETLARGMEALRAPATFDQEVQPPLGRNCDHPRRMRVGPRELYKLDVVESRVHAALDGVRREVPAIVDAATDAIVRHAETLAPRTLLFVFGDHGFVIDKTGVARQGGATPEEVLVGAFALLVGELH